MGRLRDGTVGTPVATDPSVTDKDETTRREVTSGVDFVQCRSICQHIRMNLTAAVTASALLTLSLTGIASAQTPTPPAGVVTLYAGTSGAANFMIDDTVARSGAVVRFSNFRIYAQPIEVPNGPVDMDVETVVLNCETRTVSVEGIELFKATGEYITRRPGDPVGPIEARTTWDFAARVLCDGVQLPPTQKRTGWRAAREVALIMMARA